MKVVDDWGDREYYDDEDPGGGGLRLIPGAFNCTDIGNSQRFLARFRDQVLYSPQRKMWLIWNGREWEWDETMRVAGMCKEVALGILKEAAVAPGDDKRKELIKWHLKSESSGAIASMAELVKSAVPIKVSQLDTDPMLLNCLNGTLDLNTGILREHRREDLITKTTGVRYVPGAKSETWDSVLMAAVGDNVELAEYLRRFAGYACTGRATERAFFFIYGPKGTGKSTVTDAFRAALGTYATSTPMDTWLKHAQIGGNRGDLVALQGVRFVVSGEAPKGAKWDTPLIKGATGGDPIKASDKFEKAVEYFAQFTICVVGNDKPHASVDDDAFWERMKLILLDRPVPMEKRVANIREILREPANAEAILAWMVDGCAEWLERGIGTCPVVEKATAEYRDEADIFKQFVDDYFELKPGLLLSETVFRKHYRDWCRNEDIKRLMNSKELEKLMKERFGVGRKKTNSGRFWVGLELRSDRPAPESSGDEYGLGY